eukprot:8382773-Pyramimonas_sp.AAC.1
MSKYYGTSKPAVNPQGDTVVTDAQNEKRKTAETAWRRAPLERHDPTSPHRAGAHVAVGQPEVLLGGDVAEEGRARRADGSGADSAGDVIVAGGDVRHQGAQLHHTGRGSEGA